MGNLLEIEFLFMINFNLFVEPSTFKTYNERLMMHSLPEATKTPTKPVPKTGPPPAATAPPTATTKASSSSQAYDAPHREASSSARPTQSKALRQRNPARAQQRHHFSQ